MNSKDLFNAVTGIDEELIVRADNCKQTKVKADNRIVKRMIPIVVCLAIAFISMFGLINLNSLNNGNYISVNKKENSHFGLLVASAAGIDSISIKQIEKGYNVTIPYECKFLIERTEGMTTEQKKNVFDKLNANNNFYIENIDRTYSGESTLSPTENSIYAINSVDYFSFSIDNPELLDRIVVSGSGNYSFTKHTKNTCIGGAGMGSEIIISGSEYRYDNTVGISWTPSFEIIESFENDKDMKVSDITDKLVFTAYFNDGTTEKIVVDIAFDDNSIMSAVIK